MIPALSFTAPHRPRRRAAARARSVARHLHDPLGAHPPDRSRTATASSAWDLPGTRRVRPRRREPFTVGELADAVARRHRGSARRRRAMRGSRSAGPSGCELCLRHPDRVLGRRRSWPPVRRSARRRAGRSRGAGAGAGHVRPDRRIARSAGSRRTRSRATPSAAGRLLHALQDADDESYALCSRGARPASTCAPARADRRPPCSPCGRRLDPVVPAASAEIAAGVRRGRSRVAIAGAPPARHRGTCAPRLRRARDAATADHGREAVMTAEPTATRRRDIRVRARRARRRARGPRDRRARPEFTADFQDFITRVRLGHDLDPARPGPPVAAGRRSLSSLIAGGH